MKLVDTILHITDLNGLTIILDEGFKPSYAKETLRKMSIRIAMVSFSNILLRDWGEDEVISYGSYGLGFTREWAIKNNLNPVIYTYEAGELETAMEDYLNNSVLLSRLKGFKKHFAGFTKIGKGKFSDYIKVTNTSKEVINLADYLSVKYDEELIEILSAYANAIFDGTKKIINLTKPYKIIDSEKKERIAYNDREWRKIYKELDFVVEGSDEYAHWEATKKPHIYDEKFRLNFEIENLKIIVIKEKEDFDKVLAILLKKHGEKKVRGLIDSKNLLIDTKANLIEQGY